MDLDVSTDKMLEEVVDISLPFQEERHRVCTIAWTAIASGWLLQK